MIIRDFKRIKKLAGFTLFLFPLLVTHLQAQSNAHKRSGFAIIDPVYNIDKDLPESNINPDGVTWIYGPAELECWRLQLLRQRKDSAKLKVGYPGEFHKPYTTAYFRLKPGSKTTTGLIRFRAVGSGKVIVNDKLIGEFKESESFHSISPAGGIDITELRFEITSNNEPSALLIEDEKISTSENSWEWRTEAEGWHDAYHFPQTMTGDPPHKLENPTITLNPENVKNKLFDFGRELLAYVIVRSSEEPKISAGESQAEALDISNKEPEQSLEMIQVEEGKWRSKNPLAFRYLYTDINQADAVRCEAFFYPARYRGAFACSDSMLTRIWMNSAYTLRLCLQDFIIDGVKRDRLPWAGDLAMSMYANAYTFADPEVVRRSLIALGRAGIKEKDINGIIDYSLWWIIAQDQYQLYFGDTLHLKTEWTRIKETFDLLSDRCDPSGFIKPENTWLFIDWVEQEKWTALQVLWWWAQESVARLAHRMGDVRIENRLKSSADQLKNELIKKVWSERDQLWLPGTNPKQKLTRHPNFLSVVSGLAAKDQYEGIRKMLENDKVDPVGTPYMAGFENMALARTGSTQYMLNRVKQYWGGMLEKGATTFWEAYDMNQKGNEQYSFYDRPHGKSLCHAWSAGPAAFLPSEIFGLKPLEDGWKRFYVDPDLGQLDWASVCVPTKFGNIIVDIDKKNISISVPEGTVLEWKGKSVEGPTLVKGQL